MHNRIFLVCAATMIIFTHDYVAADAAGRASYSGVANRDCTACHAAGAAVPTVTLSGPSSVAPGSAGTYTITVQGGPAKGAGIDVSASAGTLTATDPATKLLRAEVVQSSPKAQTGGSASFTFSWQAPATPGPVTLFGAGLSIDGDTQDSGDGTATTTMTINVGAAVNQPPVAVIAGPATGAAGAAVALDGSGSTDADGTLATYAWDFGDGTTGTGAKVTHVFTAAGQFAVKLTVTDNAGATHTATLTMTIQASGTATAPTAVPGGPYSGTVGTAIDLDGSKSVDPDGTIATYAWDFGDSTTGTGSLTKKTYTAAGTYTVVLTVTDNTGMTGTAQTEAVITAAGSPPPSTGTDPVAKITGPATGAAGVALSWDGSGSTAANGPIASYAWTFGGTATHTGATVTHTFNAAGTFEVVLTVTDAAGKTASATSSIVIEAAGTPSAPTANPGGPYTSDVGAAVTFDGSASVDPDGTIASYAWDFGDGTKASRVRPKKTYSEAGEFTVTLTVTDNSGMTAAAETKATVGAPAPGTSTPPAKGTSTAAGATDTFSAFALIGIGFACARCRRRARLGLNPGSVGVFKMSPSRATEIRAC